MYLQSFIVLVLCAVGLRLYAVVDATWYSILLHGANRHPVVLGISAVILLVLLWFVRTIVRLRVPWGVVFDIDSKQPVDVVLVSLFDDAGNKRATALTDLYGRYAFYIAEPGNYRVTIDRTHFIPAFGHPDSVHFDTVYGFACIGGRFTVNTPMVCGVPIGVRQDSFDWNHAEKVRTSKGTLNTAEAKTVHIISLVLWVLAMVCVPLFILLPTWYLGLVVAVTAVVFWVRYTWFLRVFAPGRVLRSGSAVPGAVVKVLSGSGVVLAETTTDAQGNYFILVAPGSYVVSVYERIAGKSDSALYAPVPIQTPLGFVNQVIDITK